MHTQQARPVAARTRSAAPVAGTLIDQINERIGLLIAVIGVKLPDLGEIRLGARMENNHRQGLSALGGNTVRGLPLAPVLLNLLRAPWDGWPAVQTFLECRSATAAVSWPCADLALHEAQGFAVDLTGGGVEV
jgi:hypothetical protein